MKQILQNLSSGETRLAEVPLPVVGKNSVLIKSTCSLISIGTERMLIDFGKANVIDKARQQPEKVKMVLEKVGTDGFAATYDAVKSKLDQPIPLGYCQVGQVVECGVNVTAFKPGDRVMSNGNHAAVVVVPENLVAKIPDAVSDEEASFTVLSAIGLQGIRLVQPSLGECVVVIGLGVIGLLTVQLLRAHGCRVLGVEFDESKLALAREFGAETVAVGKGEDPVEAAMAFSRGQGVDAVLITASTKSNDPVSQAARMSRKRGRIVLVGVVGLELNRSEFYEKELTFQVSCSYGPGRYDPAYEEQGIDYPVGFVRWTENRNFVAVLDMLAEQRINVNPLLTHRYSFDDAVNAYALLGTDKSAIGILLEYPAENDETLLNRTVTLPASTKSAARHGSATNPVCGFIGAGNYASRVLIPAFTKAGAELDTIVSGGGVSATHHGEKNGFRQATTEVTGLVENDRINTVAVVTRHNTHAKYVVDMLSAGKNVFVEKPLALTMEELDGVKQSYTAAQAATAPRLMVGFNRRFAPHVVKMKALLGVVQQPKVFVMTMNAGAIPMDSWVQDEKLGGGRIVGEACHYIDLMRHLAGHPITSVQAQQMGEHPTLETNTDKVIIILGFADGSFGSIHYLANGGKVFPKERIEVFAGDAVLQLDNFRVLRGYGWQGFKTMRLMKQDKGQDACVKAFLESIRAGGAVPIPFEELYEVSKVTCDVATRLKTASSVDVGQGGA